MSKKKVLCLLVRSVFFAGLFEVDQRSRTYCAERIFAQIFSPHFANFFKFKKEVLRSLPTIQRACENRSNRSHPVRQALHHLERTSRSHSPGFSVRADAICWRAHQKSLIENSSVGQLILNGYYFCTVDLGNGLHPTDSIFD